MRLLCVLGVNAKEELDNDFVSRQWVLMMLSLLELETAADTHVDESIVGSMRDSF